MFLSKKKLIKVILMPRKFVDFYKYVYSGVFRSTQVFNFIWIGNKDPKAWTFFAATEQNHTSGSWSNNTRTQNFCHPWTYSERSRLTEEMGSLLCTAASRLTLCERGACPGFGVETGAKPRACRKLEETVLARRDPGRSLLLELCWWLTWAARLPACFTSWYRTGTPWRGCHCRAQTLHHQGVPAGKDSWPLGCSMKQEPCLFFKVLVLCREGVEQVFPISVRC